MLECFFLFSLQHVPAVCTHALLRNFCFRIKECVVADVISIFVHIPVSQIAALASSLRTLADMKEPVGEVLKRTEVSSLDEKFIWYHL